MKSELRDADTCRRVDGTSCNFSISVKVVVFSSQQNRRQRAKLAG